MNKKIFYILLILSFITSCVTTKSKPSVLDEQRIKLDEEEKWRYESVVKESKPIKPLFPLLTHKSFSNGLKLYLMEDKSLPIAQVEVVFKNGSRLDSKDKAGLLFLTANMLSEGTKKLSSLEFAEEVANLGTSVSVSVSNDATIISAAVMSDKVQDILNIIVDMIEHPRFSGEDFDRVKWAHLNNLKSQQGSAASLATKNLEKYLYEENHPYGHPISGSIETVQKITLEDIKKAHQEFFASNNAAVIAVGDIDLDQIEKYLESNLLTWNKQAKIDYLVPNVPIKKEAQFILVEHASTPQTQIMIGYPAVNQKSNEVAALLVLGKILTDLPTSRIGMELRENKGWTYGVSSLVNPFWGQGYYAFNTNIKVPFGSDAVKEIFSQLAKVRNEYVSDIELLSAKNSLLFSAASNYETIASASGIAAGKFIYDLPLNYDEEFYDKIESLTKEDLMNVAKKYFAEKNATVIAVGDPEVMRIPLEKMNMGKVIKVPFSK